MEIIYKSTDGRYFDDKKSCLNYELKLEEYAIIKAQYYYMNYRENFHRGIFAKYLRLKKSTYKDYERPVGITSNTQMRKEYWRMRMNAKMKLEESELELKKIKDTFYHAIKTYKIKKMECLKQLSDIKNKE